MRIFLLASQIYKPFPKNAIKCKESEKTAISFFKILGICKLTI